MHDKKDMNSEHNVIFCGRGAKIYNHQGNVKFRKLIKTYVPCYVAMRSRIEKTDLLNWMYHKIYHEEGMKFLDCKNNNRELTEKEARKKIGHRFRDSALEKKGKASSSSSTAPEEMITQPLSRIIRSTDGIVTSETFDTPKNHNDDELKNAITKIDLTSFDEIDGNDTFYQHFTPLKTTIQKIEPHQKSLMKQAINNALSAAHDLMPSQNHHHTSIDKISNEGRRMVWTVTTGKNMPSPIDSEGMALCSSHNAMNHTTSFNDPYAPLMVDFFEIWDH